MITLSTEMTILKTKVALRLRLLIVKNVIISKLTKFLLNYFI